MVLGCFVIRQFLRLLIVTLVTSCIVLVIHLYRKTSFFAIMDTNGIESMDYIYRKTSFFATMNTNVSTFPAEGPLGVLFVSNFVDRSSPITISASPTTDQLLYSDASLRQNFHLVTVEVHELARLGNQMFAHASLLGIARRNGLHPSISAHANKNRLLINAFELETPQLKEPPNGDKCGVHDCWITFKENLPCAYDPRSEKIRDRVHNARNVLLVGYLQSWRYFHDNRDDVRRELQFKPTERRIAFEYLANVREKFCGGLARDERCLTVGVHVRLTDMASAMSKEQGYTTASAEYVLNAMTYMERHLNASLIFVISSDDLAWCRTTVKYKTSPRVSFVDQGLNASIADNKWTDSAHLAILASCNHSIITVGTFGWWAAYLAGGVTVYYKDFPAPGSRIAGEFRAADYYPPDWVGLS